MNRKAIVDVNYESTGEWFDADTAKTFEERVDWNGSNNISRATGSQFDHETLLQTAKGSWILHSSSQYQGTRSTNMKISPKRAARWFIKNEYANDEIPEELHKHLSEEEI